MLTILGLESWKQMVSQRGPVETSQKSSNDEVSEFVIPKKKEVIFFKIKSLTLLPLRKWMLI